MIKSNPRNAWFFADRKRLLLLFLLVSASAFMLLFIKQDTSNFDGPDPWRLSESFRQTEAKCLREIKEKYACPARPPASALSVQHSSGLIAHPERVIVRPAFKEAVAIHSKMTLEALNSKDPALRRKFVVFSPYAGAGLGNRMMGAISTYALALLTSRIFVLNWPEVENQAARLDTLFEKPDRQYVSMYEEAFAQFPEMLDLGKCRKFQFDTFNDVNKHQSPLCEDFFKYEDEACLHVESWHFYIPGLKNNPRYKDIFEKLFEPYQILPTLLPYFFKPIPAIQRRIDAFRTSRFAEYTVGLHIRHFEWRHSEWQAKNDEFEQLFMLCAKDLIRTKAAGRNSTVFVMTEDACTKLRARRTFGCSAVFSEAPYSRSDVSGLQDAVVELYLFGECNDTILSGQSTFSGVGSSRTNVTPHLIIHDPLMCFGLLHSEPIMHQFGRLLEFEASSCVRPDDIEDMLNRSDPERA